MISAIILIKKPVVTKVQRPKLKSTNLQTGRINLAEKKIKASESSPQKYNGGKLPGINKWEWAR